MPYAPEEAFVAFHCQDDSRVHSFSSALHWSLPWSLGKYWASSCLAIFFASSGEAWLPSPEYDASVTLPSVSSDASQDVVSVSEEPPPSLDATAAPAVSLVIFGGLANVRPAGISA